jgi:hypothetical protein
MRATTSRQYIAIMAARFARARWHGTASSPAPANGLVIETGLAPAGWIEPRLRARWTAFKDRLMSADRQCAVHGKLAAG